MRSQAALLRTARTVLAHAANAHTVAARRPPRPARVAEGGRATPVSGAEHTCTSASALAETHQHEPAAEHDAASPPPDAPPLPPADDGDALPPPAVFADALTSVRVALHPQTQHRGAYASPTGAPVEPALALYCPIEGGDYVVDETVRELARQTGADVLVIDAVQLAAGEWGTFGKGKSSFLHRIRA
jgi:hypothetical protein